MAKKSKGEFKFTEIGKIIGGIADKTGIVIETNKTEKEYIGTGIHILNALFSKSILNGGIPNNRITALAGVSGVGKSFICYNICREAQKKGYGIIYIDTEFSIELTDFMNYGIDVDPEKFIFVRSNKVEDIKVFLTQLLDGLKEQKLGGKDVDKFMIVMDSAGQLASNKEVSDAKEGKDKVDMTRAKAMKQLFRIVNSDLGFLKVPMLVTNHTYFTQTMYPQEIMSGGTGLQYSASTIVFLSKAKLKTGEEDEHDLGSSGIVVTAKAAKNRLARPKKVKFEISLNSGCNPYMGLEQFCVPETFDTVGIAKGKMEVDKETGEMTFKPGGNRWYVSSAGKSVPTKQLHTSAVFTKEVLAALEPIIIDYFKYKSVDELQQVEDEFSKKQDELEVEEGIVEIGDIDSMDSEDLFD